MIDLHRDNRDMPSPCVTCADQHCRDERDTPLGGVTVVTLVDMVPMPLFSFVGGVAGGGYAFALCRSGLKITSLKKSLNTALHSRVSYGTIKIGKIKANISVRPFPFGERKKNSVIRKKIVHRAKQVTAGKHQCSHVFGYVKNIIFRRMITSLEKEANKGPPISSSRGRAVALKHKREACIITDQRKRSGFFTAPIACKGLDGYRSPERFASCVLNFPTRNFVRPSQPRHKSQQRNNSQHVHIPPQDHPSVLKTKGQEVEL
jgi:hypothetical protein